jgi:hypothetical protein
MRTSQEKTPPAKMMPETRGTDDVADAEVFRRGIGLDAGAFEDVGVAAEVGLEFWRAGPGLEEVFILEEGVEAAESES